MPAEMKFFGLVHRLSMFSLSKAWNLAIHPTCAIFHLPLWVVAMRRLYVHLGDLQEGASSLPPFLLWMDAVTRPRPFKTHVSIGVRYQKRVHMTTPFTPQREWCSITSWWVNISHSTMMRFHPTSVDVTFITSQYTLLVSWPKATQDGLETKAWTFLDRGARMVISASCLHEGFGLIHLRHWSPEGISWYRWFWR